MTPKLVVAREALDRIVNEIRLEPGKATIRYSFKAEPSGYTCQEPSGPSFGARPVYDAVCYIVGLKHPKFRKTAGALRGESHGLPHQNWRRNASSVMLPSSVMLVPLNPFSSFGMSRPPNWIPSPTFISASVS